MAKNKSGKNVPRKKKAAQQELAEASTRKKEILRIANVLIVLAFVGYLLIQGHKLAGKPAFTETKPPGSSLESPPLLTIITDSKCKPCSIAPVVDDVAFYFPDIEVSLVEHDSPEGKALIEELGIIAVPAYVFDEKITGAGNYSMLKDEFEPNNGRYLLGRDVNLASRFLQTPGIEGAPTLGREDAPVTVIIYNDFKCKYCRDFVLRSLPYIQHNYVKPGNMRLVFKNLPLDENPQSVKAAEAVLCAHDQGKFMEMHNMLFMRHWEWYWADDPVDAFLEFGSELGLTDEFKACLLDSKHAGDVKKDVEEGRRFGLYAVPAFFFDDWFFEGLVDPADFGQLYSQKIFMD